MRWRLRIAAAALLFSACVSERSARPPAEPDAPIAARSEEAGECWSSPPASGTPEISFSDVTEERGLLDPLLGMFGHAAAWGDVNGDGWPDLFVGTFADKPAEEYRVRGATGPSPDRLLIGGPGGFRPDPTFPELYGRTSGATFADLDVDGDPDLVVSRNVRPQEGGRPTDVLKNESGRFSVVEGPGIPPGGGRSVGVLHADRDGLPDLFVAEDRWVGGSSVLLRNLGGLRFEDATAEAGIPGDVHGLGVATADVTGDGWSDLFVAGSNRMFVANGDGTFREAPGDVFHWEAFGAEDDVSGASFGDLNRDGLPDLVLGHHYNSTVDHGKRVPIRVYIHRGVDDDGTPRFEDVTKATGLPALPTKAPHVEVNDFDNDGWPDILATASAASGTRPLVFRHGGLDGDVPTLSASSLIGHPHYWVTGPTTDVDRDGRLDVLLVDWEPDRPSLLLRNETGSGTWLSFSVGPGHGGGIGAWVAAFRPGAVGEPEALIASGQVTAAQGYAAGSATLVHLGLGEASKVDLRYRLPGEEAVDLLGVDTNRHIQVPDGC
jgi:hypothetical protein